jgi:hypothetical protein
LFTKDEELRLGSAAKVDDTLNKIFKFQAGFLPTASKSCQIFLGTKWEKIYQNVHKIYLNVHKIYEMAIKHTNMSTKYIKCAQNIPNGDKIYQKLPLQGTPKFTQIWFLA